MVVPEQDQGQRLPQYYTIHCGLSKKDLEELGGIRRKATEELESRIHQEAQRRKQGSASESYKSAATGTMPGMATTSMAYGPVSWAGSDFADSRKWSSTTKMEEKVEAEHKLLLKRVAKRRKPQVEIEKDKGAMARPQRRFSSLKGEKFSRYHRPGLP